MKDNSKALLGTLQDQIALLNEQHHTIFQDCIKYVLKHRKDAIKAQVLLSCILDDMIETQNQNKVVNTNKGIKEYVLSIEKKISYKNEINIIKDKAIQKFMVSGFWATMCSLIVILFIKEFLIQNYLINLYVDSAVAIIAFYIVVNQIKRQNDFVSLYGLSQKGLIVEYIGIVVALVVSIVTITSPFDISFVILVIGHMTSRKIITDEMNKGSS